MRCIVCRSPQVQNVDALLATGRSARGIALELGLPIESTKRHARSHTTHEPSNPQPTQTDPLGELVAALRGRALSGSDASQSREYRLALAAQAEQAAAPPTYDVLRDATWLRLRGLLLRALDNEPSARQKVMDAIREAESSGA